LNLQQTSLHSGRIIYTLPKEKLLLTLFEKKQVQKNLSFSVDATSFKQGFLIFYVKLKTTPTHIRPA